MPLGIKIGLSMASGGRAAFSPLSLSPALWLKADAGLEQTSGGTTATADGDPVGRWLDQSGNGNHVSQATAGKRGTLKLAIQNGLPVIRFAAASLQFLFNASPTGLGTSGYTIFLVATDATGLSFPMWVVLKDSVYELRNNVTGTVPEMLYNAGGAALDAAGAALSWHQIDARSGGGTATLGVDGVEVTHADTSNFSSSPPNVLSVAARAAGGQYFTASAGNITLTRAYLKAKWATP